MREAMKHLLGQNAVCFIDKVTKFGVSNIQTGCTRTVWFCWILTAPLITLSSVLKNFRPGKIARAWLTREKERERELKMYYSENCKYMRHFIIYRPIHDVSAKTSKKIKIAHQSIKCFKETVSNAKHQPTTPSITFWIDWINFHRRSFVYFYFVVFVGFRCFTHFGHENYAKRRGWGKPYEKKNVLR